MSAFLVDQVTLWRSYLFSDPTLLLLVLAMVSVTTALYIYAFKLQSVVDRSTFARGFSHTPEEMQDKLSPEAKKFIKEKEDELLKSKEAGVGDGKVYDTHAHLVGVGTGKSGCYFATAKASLLHPIMRIKYCGFVSAAGMSPAFRKKREWKDRDYAERIAKLVRATPNLWGKVFLLGMDKVYNEKGKPDDNHTGLYVPNDFVFKVCETYPDIFAPVVSINPYRKDAIQELERCAKRGARLVKWLPNSQHFNPGSPLCDPFYDKMFELNMVLLSHTGREHTIDGGKVDQSFGNPLHLKRPLNKGVRVIAAHCSTKGTCIDFENGDNEVPCLDVFLRMMEDKRYEKLLFADISALTSSQRVGPALATILERKDIHPRLLNGSDYPLPAINIVVHTKKLVKMGFITSKERKILNEIYDYNPLLFDMLLKRTLCYKGNKFPVSVFTRNKLLPIYPD